MKKKHRRGSRKPNLNIYEPPYPNAAAPDYFLNKVLNGLAAVVSAFGVCSVLLFFFLLG